MSVRGKSTTYKSSALFFIFFAFFYDENNCKRKHGKHCVNCVISERINDKSKENPEYSAAPVFKEFIALFKEFEI